MDLILNEHYSRIVGKIVRTGLAENNSEAIRQALQYYDDNYLRNRLDESLEVGIKKRKYLTKDYKMECSQCHKLKATRPDVYDKRLTKVGGDEKKLGETYLCMKCR